MRVWSRWWWRVNRRRHTCRCRVPHLFLEEQMTAGFSILLVVFVEEFTFLFLATVINGPATPQAPFVLPGRRFFYSVASLKCNWRPDRTGVRLNSRWSKECDLIRLLCINEKKALVNDAGNPSAACDMILLTNPMIECADSPIEKWRKPVESSFSGWFFSGGPWKKERVGHVTFSLEDFILFLSTFN